MFLYKWCRSRIPDCEFCDKKKIDLNNRRSGLSGPTASAAKNIRKITIINYPKEKSEERDIEEALKQNTFLRNVLENRPGRLRAVINAMYSRKVSAHEVFIKEGDVGTQLYVTASGTYETSIKDKVIETFSNKRVIGELAILYDIKRQATIKAVTDGNLWVLNQNVYQILMVGSEIEQQDQLVNFLSNVQQLNTVDKDKLVRVSELLKREVFPAGHVIIREGEHGDKFYIISAGTVSICHENGESEMSSGEFFGQLALLAENNLRQATVTATTPIVECYTLARQEFIDYFGAVKDITCIPDFKSTRFTNPNINPYKDINLEDLLKIDTIGIGAFGRVLLVKHRDQSTLSFALKYLKKVDVVQQQQQERVFNEKNIQMQCNSIFISKLHKTFKDRKYIYFLMEACLGGDLWTLLQNQTRRRFHEKAAKFYAASALEALSYLHDRGIVYRDLKPENLLLDTRGYLKLTDFGFAKPIDASGKTYTFTGTPEYLAPEVLLNNGHNKAVDYWALGVLVFELLSGRTPFQSKDLSTTNTFNLILNGIETVRFPSSMSRNAQRLVKELCRPEPVKRLGCQVAGAQAVRDHSWFVGFYWDQLRRGDMVAPFNRKVMNDIDLRYFENFPKDTDIPPEDLTDWDIDF